MTIPNLNVMLHILAQKYPDMWKV